ncbi:mannose-6-phosphate isomerase, class I [Halochromatium glycolicum]|uniref:mannose-6-phosphate isomerase n=1 Tax=Halochromatium glycolicum TaxID=85075 RepID=A0AAJ0U1K7_9GAMM|nr:mannose-6-phosphate isomerase, class I [Halochromatium glycolicum]MBK1703487.1 mannose-6-phosphate isomerase, class I [Halochromatium glycolicum]
MDSPAGPLAFALATPTGDDLATAVAAFQKTPTALPLQCGVQHYGWGDPGFIPALIDAPNPRGLPFAELWIGAHPDLLATLQLGGWRLSLAELISAAPETMLGEETRRRFGTELPFLLKVLAARHPLSIQAHPTREQARDGYQREDAIGLALTDARRSYRDRNHKPELLVALTDFYALRGFRPLETIQAELSAAPELSALAAPFRPTRAGLFELYHRMMELDQAAVDTQLRPLIERYRREREGQAFDPGDRRDWLLEADRLFSNGRHCDRGLFSILLLNLVSLHPGEAIFLPAGELHAYLRGAGIELMANSNNVLRGGLTRKHIDVPSLLETLQIRPGPGAVLQPQPQPGNGADSYLTPAPEFLLERHTLSAGEERTIGQGPPRLRLGLVIDGQVTLDTGSGVPLGLEHGATFVIPAACRGTLRSTQRSVVFTARVP